MGSGEISMTLLIAIVGAAMIRVPLLRRKLLTTDPISIRSQLCRSTLRRLRVRLLHALRVSPDATLKSIRWLSG